MKTTTYALAALLVVSGCALQQEQRVDEAFLLTPEHFRSTAVVRGDALDTSVVITTQPGFAEKSGLLGVVWDDNFLRATIDKKSGTTILQVYQVLRYQDKSWRFFNSVNFETPEGPQVQKVTVIDRNVDCKGSKYGGCTYAEHVAFSVSETLLREIAARYAPGAKQGWRFRFNGRSTQAEQVLLGAEVVGFLARLDAYRASRPKAP